MPTAWPKPVIVPLNIPFAIPFLDIKTKLGPGDAAPRKQVIITCNKMNVFNVNDYLLIIIKYIS